jgi:phosphoribosyl-ATP pyrophosphohydrolase/phosphoribosyl-AMP cyclohydrolase/histidinol dehydrogenase
LNTLTCWGEPTGLRHLEATLKDRLKNAPAGSYTKRLFDDPELLRDNLVEEAQELSEAETKQHVAEELADVLYFAMAKAAKAGVSIDDAVAELDKRTRKVTRRQGDSKAFRIEEGDKILNK